MKYNSYELNGFWSEELEISNGMKTQIYASQYIAGVVQINVAAYFEDGEALFSHTGEVELTQR